MTLAIAAASALPRYMLLHLLICWATPLAARHLDCVQLIVGWRDARRHGWVGLALAPSLGQHRAVLAVRHSFAWAAQANADNV